MIYLLCVFDAVTYIISKFIYAEIQNKYSRKLIIHLLRSSIRHSIGFRVYGFKVHVFDLSNWQLSHSTACGTGFTNFVFKLSFRNSSYIFNGAYCNYNDVVAIDTLFFIPAISDQNSEIMDIMDSEIMKIMDAELGKIIQPCLF